MSANQPDIDNNDNMILLLFRVIQEYIVIARAIYSCITLTAILYYINTVPKCYH